MYSQAKKQHGSDRPGVGEKLQQEPPPLYGIPKMVAKVQWTRRKGGSLETTANCVSEDYF
jgi:hypothetical protein